MTKAQAAEREEAIERLRQWIKPGDTVYTILRHVSRSGMMRHVSVIGIDCEKGRAEPTWLTYNVARAIGFPLTTSGQDAIKVGGCGMDVGSEVVYNLACALFKDGFECIGKDCPAADHSNGDRNYEPHMHGKYQGGYALRQRWL